MHEYGALQGDTLYSLAKKFGVKMESIQAANGIEDPNFIHAGMSQPLSNFKFDIDVILSLDYFNRKLLQLSNYVKSVCLTSFLGDLVLFFIARGYGM
jgi:LysM repeat protein